MSYLQIGWVQYFYLFYDLFLWINRYNMNNTIINLLFGVALSLRIIEEARYGDLQQGLWTKAIEAQQEYANFSSQYFLCGFQFQAKTWNALYQCECKKRRRGQRKNMLCQLCRQTKNTQANAIRLIYCLYTQWQNQIVKQISAESPRGVQWRNRTMCSKNFYANGFAGNYGISFKQQLGLVGLRLQCSTLSQSESQVVEEGVGTYYQKMHNPSKNGLFISGIYIKVQKGNRLWGFGGGYEWAPKISKAEISYQIPPKYETFPDTIGSETIQNCGSQNIANEIGMSNTFETKSSWRTQNTYIKTTEIANTIKFEANFIGKIFGAGISTEISSKFAWSSSSTYGFNKQITQNLSITEKKTYIIPSRKSYEIKKVLYKYTGRVPFKCKLTYVSRTNGQFLFEQVVEGIWQGTRITNSIYQIFERNLTCHD